MSVFLRDLNTCRIDWDISLKISKFIPEGLYCLIKNNVPDNDYIIGVKYESGECQICISGHIKENENIEEGCKRELLEELFLKPKEKNIKILNSVNNNNFYCIPIKDTYVSKTYIINKVKDTDKRAVVCIHGSELDIQKYLFKINKQEFNNDNINGIWAAKKSKILGVIDKLEEYKINKKNFYLYP